MKYISIKGGCCFNESHSCCSADHYYSELLYKGYGIGFRLIKKLKQ